MLVVLNQVSSENTVGLSTRTVEIMVCSLLPGKRNALPVGFAGAPASPSTTPEVNVPPGALVTRSVATVPLASSNRQKNDGSDSQTEAP